MNKDYSMLMSVVEYMGFGIPFTAVLFGSVYLINSIFSYGDTKDLLLKKEMLEGRKAVVEYIDSIRNKNLVEKQSGLSGKFLYAINRRDLEEKAFEEYKDGKIQKTKSNSGFPDYH